MNRLINEFSSKVADGLDQGMIPWRLPFMPRNVLTNRPYGGVNPILLNLAATRLKLSSPYWGTHLQWKAVGIKVRQNDMLDWAARIMLFKENKSARARRIASYRLVRDFVYNLDQTDRAITGVVPRCPQIDPATSFSQILSKVGLSVESACQEPVESGYYHGLGHKLLRLTEASTGEAANPELSDLRADIGAGYLAAILGAEPSPILPAGHDGAQTSRWASQIRSRPEKVFDLCMNITVTLEQLLQFAGINVPWYIFANDPEEMMHQGIAELFDFLYEPQRANEMPQEIVETFQSRLRRLKMHRTVLKPFLDQLTTRIKNQPTMSEKDRIIIQVIEEFLKEGTTVSSESSASAN